MKLLLAGMVAVALVGSAPASADTSNTATPLAFSARYAVVRAGFTLGWSRMSLTPQNDGRYLYETLLWPNRLLALFHDEQVRESSLWVVNNGRIRPLKYHYRRIGGKNEREATLIFDWERRRVINRVQGNPWRLSVPDNTLDRLSAQFALMQDLAKGESRVTYFVADGGRLRRFEFGIVGEDRLETDIGTYHVVKVKRLNAGKRSTVLWCAPDLNYLPMRIDQVEKDGATYRMLIRSLQGSPHAGTAADPPK
jgi:hypothetical protein